MIICVAITPPKVVKTTLKLLGFTFSMWKPDKEIDSDRIYGYFNFEDLRASRPKRTPIFFNIVSAFDHIAINHPIFRYDYRQLPNGMIFFNPPNTDGLVKALDNEWRNKDLRNVLFQPAKVEAYKGSELARLWNDFIITLPFNVAEAFMVCFLQSVRNNDKDGFAKFIIDNRLIGTGNKKQFSALEEHIKLMWPIFRASIKKSEKAQKKVHNFLKEYPDLKTSLSRFLFWNRSYKGKDLSSYMDDEDNVSYGIS